jgi:hypothetical protein
MAHLYVVDSATFIPSQDPNVDPPVTIIGTVDGIAVTVQVWLSAVKQANQSGGFAAVKNLIAPIMLAQAVINSPAAPVAPVQLPTGSFTQ